jgi:bis(5'-nucleosidyl)-tetraphosphatase
METIKDYSYGVIPLLKRDQQWKVFLINQIPRNGTLFWTFPKGHPEEGETHPQTARRELLEETGIVPDSIDEQMLFTQAYSFMCDNQLIDKKVLYYLGFVSLDKYKVQIEEVKEAGWFTFEEAQHLLTHDIAKALLTEVKVYLESN